MANFATWYPQLRPGGRGGRPRALIPGGGTHRSWLGGRGVREAGQGLGGGCKGFGSGGVSGRGAGKFRNVVFLSFLTHTKRRKMAFFLKDALWGGGGGYPPELAWWTGG